MSKFWQKKYTSKYTGKEIDDAISQVIEGGGGGGGTVYLESEYIETAPDTSQLHIKKTIEEIAGLVSAGSSVILVVATGEVVNYYNLVEISENQAVFSFNSISSSIIVFTGYVFQNLVTPHDGYKAKAIDEPYYELEYTPSN